MKKASSSERHAAAKVLGEAGGRKGGPARAKVLTAEERSRIAESGGKASARSSKKKSST